MHQTVGWEGTEFIADFDVNISADGQTYRYIINNEKFESYIKIVKVDTETGKPFLMRVLALRSMIQTVRRFL